mmetsp:Transcript_88421/g.153489  ORF Transcript_88421/g.153489 Transcript_88421/m.153489 type:complete len:269 (+) Transcript_88421:253-1059(+)
MAGAGTGARTAAERPSATMAGSGTSVRTAAERASARMAGAGTGASTAAGRASASMAVSDTCVRTARKGHVPAWPAASAVQGLQDHAPGFRQRLMDVTCSIVWAGGRGYFPQRPRPILPTPVPIPRREGRALWVCRLRNGHAGRSPAPDSLHHSVCCRREKRWIGALGPRHMVQGRLPHTGHNHLHRALRLSLGWRLPAQVLVQCRQPRDPTVVLYASQGAFFCFVCLSRSRESLYKNPVIGCRVHCADDVFACRPLESRRHFCAHPGL